MAFDEDVQKNPLRGVSPKIQAGMLEDLHREGQKAQDDDPWKNRGEGMRCVSCMWYVKKEAASLQAMSQEKGRCRRHAPTMGGYPVVFPNDWCGDHKLK